MKVALVDDQLADINILRGFIQRFAKEEQLALEVSAFTQAIDFIEQYKCNFDILLLDIEMPEMDGMSIAKKIRETDQEVVILFITHMGQFAIRGYEVNAIDFLIKPVTYFNFCSKLRKAISVVKHASAEKIILDVNEGMVAMPLQSLLWVDKQGNTLVFHTEDGELTRRGNIGDTEKQLLPLHFAKCNRGCLVNLRRISRVLKNDVYIGDTVLPISRGLEKTFREEILRNLRTV